MAERVGQWARLAARLEVRGGLLSRCGAGGWASLRGPLRTAAQGAVTHGSRGRRPRWLSKVVWGGRLVSGAGLKSWGALCGVQTLRPSGRSLGL